MQLQASSDLLLLQSDMSILYLLSIYCFTKIHIFQCLNPFHIGGQIENVVVNVTNGNYNRKYSLRENCEL